MTKEIDKGSSIDELRKDVEDKLRRLSEGKSCANCRFWNSMMCPLRYDDPRPDEERTGLEGPGDNWCARWHEA